MQQCWRRLMSRWLIKEKVMFRNGWITWISRTRQAGIFGWLLVVLLLGACLHQKAALAPESVYGWRYNSNRPLGDGPTIERHTPVETGGLAGVIAITGGVGHNLAVKGDGTVWPWRFNNYGQLGDRTTTDRYNAEPV